MKKENLIEALAKKTGCSKMTAGKCLAVILDEITSALKKGQKVTLGGFGIFSVAKRAARTGRNPRTGKEIKIAAKNVVKFKAGSELKNSVN